MFRTNSVVEALNYLNENLGEDIIVYREDANEEIQTNDCDMAVAFFRRDFSISEEISEIMVKLQDCDNSIRFAIEYGNNFEKILQGEPVQINNKIQVLKCKDRSEIEKQMNICQKREIRLKNEMAEILKAHPEVEPHWILYKLLK